MLSALTLAALMAATPGGSGKAAPTNTICPVLGHAVTPGKSPTVTVRGRSYYLCCAGCDAKLAANPDQYLNKDGSPKNASRNPDNSSGAHRH